MNFSDRLFGEQNTHTLICPAKLNLTLRITGRQQEGYHTLESLMMFLDIGDRLTLRPASRLNMHFTGPYASGIDASNNTVINAVRAFEKSTGLLLGTAVDVEKKIPHGGGLGAGSSNAAALLNLLNTYLPEPLSSATLTNIAAEIGADVPCFLHARACIVRGIGEKIEPLDACAPMAVVLIKPKHNLATKDVFAHFQQQNMPFSGPAHKIDKKISFNRIVGTYLPQPNDLQQTAISLCPEIKTCLKSLAAQPQCLGQKMTGSGSACFGVFATQEDAHEAAQILQDKHPEWWVRSAIAAGH